MKEHLAIFVSLLIGISAHHEVHLIPAHIICPDVTSDHDILLPDPNDCAVFYKCENGTAIPQSCPPGLEWCQILQDCTLPILANCSLSHTVVTYSPEELVTYNPNGTTPTEKPTAPSETEETCPEDSITLPDAQACSKYFICTNGVPISQDCPEGELFSTWLGICTTPDISNCINVGSQENKTCPVNNATRIDPHDCSEYYECVDNKVEHKECPPGLEFNKWFNGCYSTELAYCHTYTTVTPTTSPSTINTPIPNKNLCPEGGYTLPNPLDCHTYYVCENDNPKLQTCPDGLDYSCWDQECLPSTDGQCLPTSEHSCTNPGEKLANAQDCSSYYECKDGVTEKVDCENDLEYNEWFKKCVNSSLAHCSVHPTTTPTSTSQSGKPTPTENNNCPDDNATLPNLFDCHSYYICRNNNPVQEECPDGMDYSCWDQACVPVDSANCVDQINQDDNCGHMNTKMPSTEDCSSYYECINGKVVSQKCESGLEFNAWFGICIESSESHCPLHSTPTPNSTPTTHTNESTTTSESNTPTPTPNPLCPLPNLQYPSIKYCNAYMRCDENRQLHTIICNPPQFHYNCETKQCENITHCCTKTTATTLPSTPPTIPQETTNPTGTSSPGTDHSTGSGSTETVNPTGTGSPGTDHPTGSGSTETANPTGTGSPGTDHSTGSGSTETVNPTGTSSPGTDHPTGSGSTETANPTGTISPGTDHSTGSGSTETANPTGTGSPGTDHPTGSGSTETVNPTGTTSPGTDHPTGSGSTETANPTGTTSPGIDHSTGSGSTETANPTGTGSPGTDHPTGSGSTETVNPTGTTSPGTDHPTGSGSTETANPTGTTSPGTDHPTGSGSTETANPTGTGSPGTDHPTGSGSTETVNPTGTTSPGTDHPTGSGSTETANPTGTGSPGTDHPTGSGSTETVNPTGTTSPGTDHPTGSGSTETANPTGTISPGTDHSTGSGSTETANPTGTGSPGTDHPTGSGSTETVNPTGTTSPGTDHPTGSGSTETANPTGTGSPGTDHPTGSGSTETVNPTGTTSPGTDHPTGSGSTETANPTGTGSPGTDHPTGSGSTETVNPTGTGSPGTDHPTGSGSPETANPTGTTSPGTDHSTGSGSTETANPTGTGSPGTDHPTGSGSTETVNPTGTSSPDTGSPGTGSPGTDHPTGSGSTETANPTGTGSPGTDHPTGSGSTETVNPTGTGSPGTDHPTGTAYPTGTGSPGTDHPTGSGSTETANPTGTGSPGTDHPTGSGSTETANPTGTSSPGTDHPTGSGSTETANPTGTGSPGTDHPTGSGSTETANPTGTGSPGTDHPTGSGSTETANPTGTSSPSTGSPGTGSPGTDHPTGSGSTETVNPTGTGSPGTDHPTGSGSTETANPTGTGSPGTDHSTGSGSTETVNPTGTGSPGTDHSTGTAYPTGITQSPSPLCPVNSTGIKYPSYTKCNGYMTCDPNRQLLQKECIPPEYNYNCETKKCENITHCCAPNPPTPTPTPSTTIPPSPSPDPNDDVCPSDGAKLPNPIDCTLYFICRNNTPVSQSCPSGQEYSCWEQTCKNDNDATCIKNVLPGQSCSKNDDQLPNMSDCGTYYKCENGKIVLKYCTSGLFYNKWFNECVNTSLSHCQTYPTPPGSTILPPATTISPSGSNNVCPFEGAQLPNPMNCSTYFVCINNEPTLQNCPAGQEYSCWDQTCESSSVAKCIINSHPGDSCSIENLLVPDINDCKSYYKCSNGSITSEQCPSEKEFNSWFQKCLNSTYSHCQPSTISPTTPTTTISDVTITPSPVEDVCPKNGAKLPNPIDCSSYFICVNGTPEIEKCPNGQEYSCWDQECETPENAVCINVGSQEGNPCSKDDEQLQNVEDCSTYYECVEGKIQLQHCTERKWYNKWFKKCLDYDVAHCNTDPTMKPSSTIVPPQTTISPSSEENVCPFEGALLPNPLDCSTYFACQNSKPVLQNCPSGEGYSCWNQQCESGAQDQCNPNSEIGHTCSTEELILPNTEDCDGYLECQNGTIVKQTCPSGLKFNEWFQKCVEGNYSHCESESTTPKSTASSDIPTPTLPSGSCPLAGFTLPNPLHCNSYFTCENGKIVSEQCPAGEIYSCWDQRCEAPQDATCINQGNQEGHHCSNNGELLPNIADCSSYYECVGGKVTIKVCANGLIYSQWFKACLAVSLTTCVTYPTVTTPPTTSFPDPTGPIGDYNVCPYEDALLPNPLDCKTYYKCINGTISLQDCPNGYEYSCWDQKCELDSDATCVTNGAQNGESCKVNELKITDVTNCNNYYECVNGTIIQKHCPPGEEFNAAFQACYAPKLSHCSTYPTSEPGPSTPPATTETPTPNDTCPSDGALLPNPLNCSAYYICKDGIPTPELCADGFEYSCWNQECEPAGQAHCISEGNQNGTSCKNNGQKLQNIEDCHSYYECTKGKVTLKHCILNWYYNKWFKICVPFAILAHCKPGSTLPPTPTPKPTPLPIPTEDICPIGGALLPNPLDCTKYFKCEGNKPVSQTCPSGQEYSCWDQQCEATSEAQCINDDIQLGKNCSRDGVSLQNLGSCTSYYVCKNGKVEMEFCFIGLQYNKWYQKCVFSSLAHCNTSHINIPTTSTTLTVLPPSPTPIVPYDICPTEGALLPNPVDCTSFYKCINGTPTIAKCGDGMEYSCWDQKCKLDADANCISVGSQLGVNCSIDGLRLSNIENCSSYYQCNNGTTYLIQCPPGLEFNDRFQNCYPPDQAHCTTYPTQTPPTGTVPKTTVTPQPGNDICPTEGTLLPNPVNCSQFFKCINGTPTPQLCADGYEYSCWDQVCEPAGEAQCVAVAPPPEASCDHNGQKNPDPSDCRKYFECVNHVQETKTCPGHLHYNKWFKKCVKKDLAHCNETTTIKPTPSTITPAPNNKDYCPRNNATIPNPTDCSSYYKCIKNKPVLQKCPKNQEYSVWDQQCKNASEAQCIRVGSPLGQSCSRDGVTVQNLVSCTSYYECQGGIVQVHYCFIAFKYNRWYEDCELSPFSHCDTYSTIAPSTTTTVAPVVTTKRYPLAICTENNKKVPMTTNCNQYYNCEYLKPILYNCPPGYNYNAWTEDCEPVSKALCLTPSPVGQSCSKQKQSVPDPTNCKDYYVCKGNKIKKESCPTLKLYSVWAGECVLSIFATCANNIV